MLHFLTTFNKIVVILKMALKAAYLISVTCVNTKLARLPTEL